MDRHWIKSKCGACGKLADIRVEENDPPRLWRRGPERHAIEVPEGYVLAEDGKAVQCKCGDLLRI